MMILIDPALCLHPRIEQIDGPIHRCLECDLRGELVGWRGEIEMVCIWCGQDFSVDAYKARIGRARYCSMSCASKDRVRRGLHRDALGRFAIEGNER